MNENVYILQELSINLNNSYFLKNAFLRRVSCENYKNAIPLLRSIQTLFVKERKNIISKKWVNF